MENTEDSVPMFERSKEVEEMDIKTERAFIGYGRMDMLTFPVGRFGWQEWNHRQIVEIEVDHLVDSYKGTMNRYRPHNAFPIIVKKGQLLKDASDRGFDTPETLPIFTAEDVDGILRPASGQHRYKAIFKFKTIIDDRVAVLEGPEKVNGRKKKDTDVAAASFVRGVKEEKELKKYRAFVPTMGMWLVKFYDEGE